MNTALISLTPTARRVVRAIAAAGGRPVVVGGAVRDALCSAEASKDIDIEVYGVANVTAIVSALSPLGKVDKRGQAFGVLALTSHGEDFDISFPRRDSASDFAHRGVQVTVDANLSEREAFARRDFTINAIGWEPLTGRVIDPFDGRTDLDNRVLRHTSDAFAEDPLRVLRAVQFAGRFSLALAPETLAECRRVVALIERAGGLRNVVSAERVWGEWRKLLRRGVAFERAFDALRETGLSRQFPQLHELIGVQQDPRWHAEGDVWTHTALAAEAAARAAESDGIPASERELVVLATICHDLGKATHTVVGEDAITSHGHAGAGAEVVPEFLQRLGAPQRLVAPVAALVREHMAHASGGAVSAPQVRRLVRRLASGGATLHEWARVVDADCAGRGASAKPSPAASWLDVATRAEVGTTPRKGVLTGQHLIEAGLRPGPAFSTILAEALEVQDAGGFDDLAGALAWFRTREG